MVAVAAQIDSGWLGSPMTFVCTRGGTQLGTGAATVSPLASGLVKAVATIDMSSYGAGLVDLSLIENTTKSLIWLGTIEIDASGTLVNRLATIAADTALIGGGQAIVQAQPVNAQGKLDPIIIGDDYLLPSRVFVFDVDPPLHYAIGDAKCYFGGSAFRKGKWLVEGTLSAVTVEGAPKWRMTFELPNAQTGKLLPACYKFSAELRGPEPEHKTQIRGEVDVVESQTWAGE